MLKKPSKEEQVGSQSLLSQREFSQMSAGLESDLYRFGSETPTPQRLTGERSHYGESCLIHQRPDGPFGGLAEGEVGSDEPDAFYDESSLGGKSEGAPTSLGHQLATMVGAASPPPPDTGPF